YNNKYRIFLILVILFTALSNYLLFAQEEDKKLFEQGVKAYQEKDFDTAIKNFKKLSEKIFGHEPSFYNLGLSYTQKSKYAQALEAFQEASLYNPYNLFSYKFIVDLFILTKKYEGAINKIKDVIERNPQDTDAHLKYGLLALEKKDFDTAIKEFTFVRNVDPDDVTGRINLAGLFIQNENFDNAKSYLSEVQEKTFKDIKTDAFRWALISYLHRVTQKPQEAQDAQKTAIELSPEWKRIKNTAFKIPPLQLEFIQYLLYKRSSTELLEAKLLDFEQSEASKRIVERILKEKEEEKKKTGLAAAKEKDTKRPLDLTGELEHTFEYYDRNPATSNPINDLNMTSNLELDGKINKNVKFSSEFQGYYNRWDHTELDYFKINLEGKNDEVDLGKFSAANFPSILTHPTIEQGVRWWVRVDREKKTELFKKLPDNLEKFDGNESGLAEVPNLGKLYGMVERCRKFFATWEMTVLAGRSKKPKNLYRPKAKNDRTYETSGQFEQWVNAFHIMTKPTQISEIGFTYSRVKDDDSSAEVSSTTYPIESEAIGIDWAIEFLDGRLKADGEYVRSKYDENVSSGDDMENKEDAASSLGLDYELNNDWDFSYDLKRIGTNYEVEGAFQTADKITQTWTAKYSAPKTIPWTVRSIDIKYEPARVNLSSSDETNKLYLTFQPKISFTLPQDAKLSFDYKYYDEDQSCRCTEYRTRTLKTELEYEHKPYKTTFKPSYTFERKDDRVASPTDEKKEDFALSIENKTIDNLTLKSSIERERKTYVGASTKAYNQHKYSIEAKYDFIPSRCDSTLKLSIDDKDQTDTNDIELDTAKFSFNYTSLDKNTKLSLEYERKLNTYEPWSETSGYRQNYTKLKYTKKF
ncbi:MAG: tetratricopeptide repeat protein, partial [Candidatus Omnitrophica bacterium]|nr:tetratricopeptide repeat protein [Candidatus Omnitrophota bacterium]